MYVLVVVCKVSWNACTLPMSKKLHSPTVKRTLYRVSVHDSKMTWPEKLFWKENYPNVRQPEECEQHV